MNLYCSKKVNLIFIVKISRVSLVVSNFRCTYYLLVTVEHFIVTTEN